MFAIGLVPNRCDVNTGVPGLHKGLQLRLTLVKEAVTHAKTEFLYFHLIFPDIPALWHRQAD
jgi:hypothetical protein